MQIVEVSPRDGFQNQPRPVTTDQKLRLIERLVASGVRRIEATSFVSPRRVPQMADADEVMAGVPRRDGVRYSALVANARGAERAVAAGADEINAVVLASDEFGRRNQGAERPAMVATYREIATIARAAGIDVTVTVGASFGCPFEGEVAVATVADLVGMLLDVPPNEICLADTIGVGVPAQVHALAAAVGAVAPGIDLRFHFHNTRNTGYANAVAALAVGAAALDASLGGIGGCPFAPLATGNIATEDLLYLLDRSGVRTTIDRDRLIDDSRWMTETLELDTPSLLPRAGDFPPRD
jgi:hydroxymethylglutaryl-CoA lyase